MIAKQHRMDNAIKMENSLLGKLFLVREFVFNLCFEENLFTLIDLSKSSKNCERYVEKEKYAEPLMLLENEVNYLDNYKRYYKKHRFLLNDKLVQFESPLYSNCTGYAIDIFEHFIEFDQKVYEKYKKAVTKKNLVTALKNRLVQI